MARPRVHQHVNPLTTYFRNLPVEPLNLEKVYGDADLPLFLDIGCGRGRFLLEMAEKDKRRNFLGVEIREPLVIEANRLAAERNVKNLHYEFCNAAFDLDVVLQELPADRLQFVTVQFPDPWFKKKHAKRRMVGDKLVETVAGSLAANGKILIQTDVEFLAGEMFELFEEHENLKRIEIDENPLPVKTERERSVENRNLPIYRTIFEKPGS
jgi:tRNA (guanine-N7-)-methyltransferase